MLYAVTGKPEQWEHYGLVVWNWHMLRELAMSVCYQRYDVRALSKERSVSTQAANDTPKSKKAVFRRLVNIYAAGNLSALDEVLAPNYVGHASAGDRDLEGFRQSILHFHNPFIYDEDSFEVNDQIVEGEKVATRMTAHIKVRRQGNQHQIHLMLSLLAKCKEGEAG
ncbi:MAG: nuclear transport factor 2 family protein [Chloracidobacterium sp.]